MHIKNNIRQKTFYIQGLRSFKNSLPKNVKKILNKKGFVYSEILNRWNYLVGNEISKVSFPKTFKPNGKNAPGTLIISAQRGNEISVEYSKNTIIEKINSFFGYKVLNNIRLETFNNLKENINKKKMHISKNTTEKFKDSLKSLNNEKIKKSLIKLINAIQK
ncbi:MAG: DUF721 domain-containing protein [Pelagibacteraceae bacterium]|jgi:hypothetical protein|nr:DUF721 domain-containing protein [Pelagibacteraceae bacterium]MBO6492023.1 DUF721 domain-containing protein [Pelagibacteraceae bacterium]MDP6440115.1 DciA family protein [Pelagibacteraceae bacterium]|tara:strand:+ start:13857 stop:14342 length:486 start_codon:yes stop_codon:yes gene_type:complete